MLLAKRLRLYKDMNSHLISFIGRGIKTLQALRQSGLFVKKLSQAANLVTIYKSKNLPSLATAIAGFNYFVLRIQIFC